MVKEGKKQERGNKNYGDDYHPEQAHQVNEGVVAMQVTQIAKLPGATVSQTGHRTCIQIMNLHEEEICIESSRHY